MQNKLILECLNKLDCEVAAVVKQTYFSISTCDKDHSAKLHEKVWKTIVGCTRDEYIKQLKQI